MRKNLFKLASLLLIGLAVMSCSNPKKMAEKAAMVQTSCNPEVLECVAGKINAAYTLTFPEKYFIKKAVLEVTPVLVYDGGEIKGKVLTIQGEKVYENNQVVSYANGGTVSGAATFDYVPGVEKAVLELRATVYNRSRTKSFVYPEPRKIADGTNCTYMLVEFGGHVGTAVVEPNNYQKVINYTKEAQILYLINQWNVRPNELKSEQVKELEKFLQDIKSDERSTVTSNDIIAYASPDGKEALNDKLADKRSNTAKTAFDKTINKKAKSDAPVNVTAAGEDWEGFKAMVENSDIQDKDLILRVLSMYSESSVREREIRNMSAIFDDLAKTILPQLRRSRFIANVEYKNWTDEELLSMINTNSDDLDEEALLYTATIVKGNDAKAAVYQKAGEKYNSSRAWNGLAATKLADGKIDEAKAALNKVSEKNGAYYNNMAVVALQEKDYKAAADYLANSDAPEAKYNQGIVDIMNGKYSEAAANLQGQGGCAEALADVLVNNLNAASAVATKDCAKQSYIRAIIAARQGNASAARAEIAKASNNAELAARSAKDIEFAKVR